MSVNGKYILVILVSLFVLSTMLLVANTLRKGTKNRSERLEILERAREAKLAKSIYRKSVESESEENRKENEEKNIAI